MGWVGAPLPGARHTAREVVSRKSWWPPALAPPCSMIARCPSNQPVDTSTNPRPTPSPSPPASPLHRASDLPGRRHCRRSAAHHHLMNLPVHATAPHLCRCRWTGLGGERGRAAGGTDTAWSSRGCIDLCPVADGTQRSSGGEDLGSRRVGTYSAEPAPNTAVAGRPVSHTPHS